jgi:hypothetical protein
MMMRVMLTALLATALAGCQGADETAPTGPADEVRAPAVAPPAGEIAMDLESQLAASRADLGERLGLPEEKLELLEARQVTWADSSLGCPQPGMAYLQVLTPGVLIRLAVEGREYRYHGGTRGAPSLCLNPQGEPLPGLEDR